MAASMGRGWTVTGRPRRSFASTSTVAAGRYSASMTTGARPVSVMSRSGCKPGLPSMTRICSESTWLPGSMDRNRPPKALLALGSVWRGMGAALSSSIRGSSQAAAQGNIRSRIPGAAAGSPLPDKGRHLVGALLPLSTWWRGGRVTGQRRTTPGTIRAALARQGVRPIPSPRRSGGTIGGPITHPPLS